MPRTHVAGAICSSRPWFALAAGGMCRCALLTSLGLLALGTSGIGSGHSHSALDVTDLSPPQFRVFTGEDGLSEEIWSTVGVDQHGFVWAGSASSLYRFDGYRFMRYPLEGAGGLVRDMANTPDGVLWALFERDGLVQFDGSRWVPGTHRGFSQRFSPVLLPHGGLEVWIGESERTLRWQAGEWVAGPAPEVSSGTFVRAARTRSLFGETRLWHARADGQIWFMTERGEGAGLWQRFALSQNMFPLTDMIVAHGDDGAEELWILGYGSGAVRLRDGGVTHFREGPGALPSEAVYSAVSTRQPDGKSSIWIASRGGLIRIQGDDVSVYDRRHGLPSNAVRGLRVQQTGDGEALLWLATEGGLARASLAQHAWQTVSLIGETENGVFGALVEPDDADGERLWVGSARRGLHMLEHGRWRVFSQQEGTLPAESVRGVWRVPGPDGLPWRLLSTVGGSLNRIQDDFSMEALDVPWRADANEAVLSVVADSGAAEHSWWVGTTLAGAWQFSGGQWNQMLKAEPGQVLSVLQLAVQPGVSKDSTIWAATSQGLFRINESGARSITHELGLPEDGHRGATLLHRDGRIELWLSSNRHGVLRVDVSHPNAPVRIDDASVPPPPDPTIYSILPDSLGRIYVCTNNGVQQLTPRGDGAFDQRVFRRRDGLVHDECNTGSQLVDEHDRYWVGTLSGLSVYDPSLEPAPRSGVPKPLHWNGVWLDGDAQRTPPGSAIVVPAGTRSLRIGYVLLAGQRETETTYRSQLVGLDPDAGDWSAEPGRSLGQLEPGEYRLRVEARDATGTAALPIELRISALPYWWQRYDVRMLAVALGLLVIAAGVRLNNRRLRQRQRVLEKTVRARTVELDAANARLTELSYVDALTDLPNRRQLMEKLERAVSDARSRHRPIGLVVIDVDHFKRYNDTHGHLAGDTALRSIARALRDSKRDGDLVARYGGEEFACLLPDADLATVLQVAERMRMRVASLAPRELGNTQQSITLSAGCLARVPGTDDSADRLLGEADGALYVAKREGRNRVVAVQS